MVKTIADSDVLAEDANIRLSLALLPFPENLPNHLRDVMYRLILEENKKMYPGCRGRQKAGNAIRFMNVAKEHDIETVGQLLEVGRARFERFKNMGRLCADRISEALDNLYGIKSW